MAQQATQHAAFTPASDSPVPDDLIGSNAADLLARKYVLSADQVILRGTLMGVVTASGEVIKSLSAAGDGSQTPFGIAAHDMDATIGPDSPPGDQEILVFVRGSFNENAVIYGTAHTKDTVREGLRDKGIYLETPVKRYP